MSTVQITISKRLKSFQEADTSSPSMGFVDPGNYVVVDRKVKYPGPETDYARITVAGKGDVWICARWKDSHYGEFEAGPSIPDNPFANEPTNPVEANEPDTPISINIPVLNFDDQDDSIDESELVSELADYDGFTYDLHNPTYPYPLKGIKVPQAPPNQNNCCTFVEGMVVKAWADNFPDFEWNNKRHGQMMIVSVDDYFSPVTAVIENGMAVKADDVDNAPQPWTVIQGWKQQWKGGHTFFIVDHHKETDRVLTLESNMAFGLNGVGFRKIGMASDFGNKPPQNWWEREDVWTWEKLKQVYQFRAMATLKVKNRKWSGIA